MRFHWDKKYFYWGLTAFLVIVFSVLFFFALFRMKEISNVVASILDILKPIIYGLAIAYLLEPVMSFFERHIHRFLLKKGKKLKPNKIKKLSRCLGILISMVLTLCVLGALISMIIPQLLTSITGIVENLPSYLNNLQSWMNQTLADNPQYIDAATNLLSNLSSFFEKWVDTDLLPKVQEIVTGLTTSILGLFSVLKNLLIGLIVSIYVLYSKDLFAAQAKKLLYAILEAEHANSLLHTVRYTHKMFGGFVTGQLLDSLLVGIICFLCMSLFGLPFPLLISVIVGVTNVIPFFGPFIGAIPSAIIILLVEPIQCLYFVIFILVLQQFDGNILCPKILGQSTGLSCFWVIFAILLGGGLFGFLGMVLGVPVFAVFYAGVRWLASRALHKKDLPEDTNDYVDLEYIDEKTRQKVPFVEEEVVEQPEKEKKQPSE